MARPSSFAKPERQAGKIMKALQSPKFAGKEYVKSVGTVRNYEQALTAVADNLQRETGEALRDLTPERAAQYLEQRGLEVKQTTLNMERQAMQKMMHLVTHRLPHNQALPVVKSEHKQVLKSRSYTAAQVQVVADHQIARNALATEVAHAAGLRAHELITIQPIAEREPSPREAHQGKFQGREGVSYTVVGKGGLVREIRLPHALSERLEAHRLPEPEKVTDRGVHYRQHYAIGGGKNWSQSFSAASTRGLGRSNGAHGVRHSFAQERMKELGKAGYDRQTSLQITSQEMGHFRPSITEVYLR